MGTGDKLSQRTGFLLSRLGFATTALFKATLAPFGLKPPQWAILNVLEDQEQLSQQALAGCVRVDPSSMVALVDDLEDAGLVERRREAEDRRRYSIRLTPQGRRVLARARKAADAHEKRLLAPLAPAERAQLHELLLRLATAGHLPASPHPPITRRSEAPSPGTAAPGPSRPSAAGGRRTTT